MPGLAGGEDPAGAADQHDPRRLIRARQVERGVDLVQHPVALGVAIGRPVERDDAHAVIDGIGDGLEFHG
jgi:hypothetical protein